MSVEGFLWHFAEVPRFVWLLVLFLGGAWIYSLFSEPRVARPVAHSQTPAPDVPGRNVPAGAPAAPLPAPRAAWTLERLQHLETGPLEQLVQHFWQAHHFKVERGNPGGTLLMIYRPATGALFAAAQCSPLRAGQVGLQRIKVFAELVQARGAALGLFYGLGGFAPDVLAFARDHKLKLIAANELLAEIAKLAPDVQHTPV